MPGRAGSVASGPRSGNDAEGDGPNSAASVRVPDEAVMAVDPDGVPGSAVVGGILAVYRAADLDRPGG
jgi:hypothetical protein